MPTAASPVDVSQQTASAASMSFLREEVVSGISITARIVARRFRQWRGRFQAAPVNQSGNIRRGLLLHAAGRGDSLFCRGLQRAQSPVSNSLRGDLVPIACRISGWPRFNALRPLLQTRSVVSCISRSEKSLLINVINRSGSTSFRGRLFLTRKGEPCYQMHPRVGLVCTSG